VFVFRVRGEKQRSDSKNKEARPGGRASLVSLIFGAGSCKKSAICLGSIDFH